MRVLLRTFLKRHGGKSTHYNLCAGICLVLLVRPLFDDSNDFWAVVDMADIDANSWWLILARELRTKRQDNGNNVRMTNRSLLF